MVPTVKQLRQSGYKVRVIHRRNFISSNKLDGGKVLSALGGETVIEITTPDNINLVGYAQCSNEDNYSKKLGVKIALGRALSTASV